MGEERADTVSRCDIVKVGISSASEREAKADTLTVDAAPRSATATRPPEARNTKGLDASHAGRSSSAPEGATAFTRVDRMTRSPKARDRAGEAHAEATWAPAIPTPMCEAPHAIAETMRAQA